MAKWTREAFAAEVRRLEGVARQNPGKYRLQVGLLAALGYAFIFLLMLGILIALCLVVLLVIAARHLSGAFIKVILLLVVLLAGVARSLWVTFEKPTGLFLTEQNAAPLFIAVRRMTDKLSAPRFHNILLSSDFNAMVVQWPRLGIFGWHTNYLIVGLPLMQSLTPEQFESVLAHELGHLRGGHGRFGAWIYRVNRTWQQLMENLGDSGATGAALRAFFGWYAPYFAAYSFALRRQDEYEADRCAATLTSARTAADALCCLPIYDDHLDKHFWEGLTKSVQDSAVPPAAPYSQMFTLLAEKPPLGWEAEKALQNALTVETGTADTHPSLSDRLRALGQEARLVPPPTETAATHFFGPHLPRLTKVLDQEWSAKVAPLWQQKHEEAVQAQRRLAELNARATTEALPVKDAWWRAQMTEEFSGDDAALPLYEELRERPEVSLPATFAVGRILVERDNSEGIPLLESVMAKDADATLSGLGLIYAFHKRNGNEAAAKDIYTQGMRHADKTDEAEEERADIGNTRTRYLPHELDEATVVRIRELVSAYSDVAEAYLVRKEVIHFPEKPLYVLGVTLAREWMRSQRDQDAANLQQALLSEVSRSKAFPSEGFVVVMAGNVAWLKGSVSKVPGSRIYAAH